MNETQLIENLDIIFKREYFYRVQHDGIDRKYEKRQWGGKIRRVISLDDNVTSDSSSSSTTDYIEKNPKKVTLKFPALEYLEKLHEQVKCDNNLNSKFMEYLDKTLANTPDWRTVVSYLSFEFLLKNGFLNEALEGFKEMAKSKIPSRNLVNILNGILSYEHYRFNRNDFDKIEDTLDSILDKYPGFYLLYNPLLTIINTLKFERLKSELDSITDARIRRDILISLQKLTEEEKLSLEKHKVIIIDKLSDLPQAIFEKYCQYNAYEPADIQFTDVS
ncbi:MAG: hypothetical protein V1921_04030 [Candidatus Altiarchaeota archaeon]